MLPWFAMALLLAASSGPPPPQEETRISIDVKNADVLDVIRLFAEVGNFQVVVDPGVSCPLTLKLKEVLWPTAFDLALRSCGLGYQESDRIYRVAPLSRLTEEAQSERRFQEERERNRARESHRFRLSYAKAQDLAPIIKKMLSPRGEVVVDARTNTLIVID
ncbi:MAG TPA: secretin N-terminal domain-containing protein [Vicinamibacteria bacterium]|nr:secretin N-terminal domain-containing protein [Vicinamibacteria bacterium]